MERIDSLIVGIDTENWGTNNGLMINGKNVDGIILQNTEVKTVFLLLLTVIIRIFQKISINESEKSVYRR